ncbi:hypothetical protein JSY14_04670 [Brachybacterium sp. EF45031]|uniref:hypothetical protein n=1 Tax=Brachybacterium sillae TaxID=2810536 RepID=UPI00217CE1DC|nr:hypothetical protein [Brachybacterium sillae]MCS6711344.1 hypothetical protein [Brachybacterium sillae]
MNDTPSTPPATVYVRRGRRLSLGGAVIIALLVSALGGAVVALLAGVTAVGGVVYFAVTAAFLVGVPLAAVIALVDALRERRRVMQREHRTVAE